MIFLIFFRISNGTVRLACATSMLELEETTRKNFTIHEVSKEDGEIFLPHPKKGLFFFFFFFFHSPDQTAISARKKYIIFRTLGRTVIE